MTIDKRRPLRAANELTHAFVQEQLPWLVNGTLEEANRDRLERHLEGCDECRTALRREERLADAMRAEPAVEIAPQAGLQALLARIDRRERQRRRWLQPFAWLANPLPLAVALQAVVIVALAAFIVFAPGREVAPAYRTLTTAPAGATGGDTLRVVFADELSLGDLRALLAPWGARIVDGPQAPGVYTLRLAGDASAQDALAALRADARVRLAEIADSP